MTKIKNNCVLITGGASGIGRLMGKMSLEKGARCLVIWDINEESIATAIEEFKSLGNVKGYKVDVSDSKQVAEIAEKTSLFVEIGGGIRSMETVDAYLEKGEGKEMWCAHAYCPHGNGKWMEITVQDPKTEIVSEGIDFRKKPITPTMTYFENALGGKVLVGIRHNTIIAHFYDFFIRASAHQEGEHA